MRPRNQIDIVENGEHGMGIDFWDSSIVTCTVYDTRATALGKAALRH